MADKGRTFTIREDAEGGVKISEEVIATIAALAATEVEGVASLAGGATNEKIAKIGLKKLRPGVRVEIVEGVVTFDLNLQIAFGYSIMDVGTQVQEKVKTAVENMTGLTVTDVNINVADVAVEAPPA